MRMHVIGHDNDQKPFRSRLLSGRLGDARADAALRALQDLNPQVDFKRLVAGTVLLVPDSPDFKASASNSVADDVVKDLRQLVRNGLDAAAARLEARKEDLSAQNAEMTAVLKSRAVAGVLKTDPEIKAQLGDVAKRFKEEQRQAIEAVQTLQAVTPRAMEELASLVRLLG